jgi:prepilin-type N-terminal cleavage/methylation domain-containing protein
MRTSSLNQSGFTLIEMIVSLALFSVVVTTSVGALLALISTNQQLQVEQSIMTNLSFALDSMTREIRTGTAYFCENRNNYNQGGPQNNIFNDGTNGGGNGTPSDVDDILGSESVDCQNGRNGARLHGLAFIEAGDSITEGSDRILYFHDSEEDQGKIYRRVGSGPAQSIVSSGIDIENLEFYVTGTRRISEGAPYDTEQPSVTVIIEAKEEGDNSDDDAKRYRIQTTVTQRTLDI